jgi:hypothetical protein
MTNYGNILFLLFIELEIVRWVNAIWDIPIHRKTANSTLFQSSSDVDSFPYLERSHRVMQSDNQNVSTEIQKLRASNEGMEYFFGDERGTSISNNRIVIGARGADNGRGAAYLFEKFNEESYSQMAILIASDGRSGVPSEFSEIGDWFGSSVDIDGNWIAIGALGRMNQTGAVYVYRLGQDDDSSVTQLAIITANNGEIFDHFGRSVATAGNCILVGADGVNNNIGSAYLFVDLSNDHNGMEWTQAMQFQPINGTMTDLFGISVALKGSTAVIGTEMGDTAYVYEQSLDNNNTYSPWTFTAKFSPSSADVIEDIPNGFGKSVALAGNCIIVGADHDGDADGAVYVYAKHEEPWSQMNRLSAASDGCITDQFGASLAISSDGLTIVVGAPGAGSVYQFQRNSTNSQEWTQVQKFMASDSLASTSLGCSIAMENNIIVAGTWHESVYIFDTQPSDVQDETSSSTQYGNDPGLI